MARFSAGVRATASAGSLIPIISVFPGGVVGGSLREIGVFNTSGTAFEIRLARITVGPGTLGAALAEACVTNPGAVAACQAFTTSTGGTPTFVDLGYRTVIGPQAGAGVIWTFGDVGMILPPTVGTLNGVCVIPETGASQIAQTYAVWDE
jgi:hypothetical protein